MDDISGRSIATVTEQQLEALLDKALEESAGTGNNQAPKAELKISAPDDAKEVQTSLPEGALGAMADSGITELKVTTPMGKITL